MKFFKLFKKEMKDLLTLSTLVGMVIGVLAFVLMGNVMGSIQKTAEKSGDSVVICDKDKTELSKSLIAGIEKNGTKVFLVDGSDDKDIMKKAVEIENHNCAVVIPKNFEAGIYKSEPQELINLSVLKTFSIMGDIDNSSANTIEEMTKNVSYNVMQKAGGNIDIEFLKAPIVLSETTIVKDVSAKINSQTLSAIAMQQSIFIPIIVFILITFATQLNTAAIANEKNDKTLETLLSAPVSRLAVIGAKMTASGVFSLLMAVVYMGGFSSYMAGMMGTMSGQNAGGGQAIDPLGQLGLKLGVGEFALIGVQLFLTILIALTISMILGALAKDLKSAQTLTTPLMIVTMIPYFVTMFLDVNTLPTAGKVLMNLIPFTHTFTASGNLLFGNTTAFFGGMIYQFVFLAGMLFLAVKIFSGDKIFTMTLDFSKKKSKKKVIAE